MADHKDDQGRDLTDPAFNDFIGDGRQEAPIPDDLTDPRNNDFSPAFEPPGGDDLAELVRAFVGDYARFGPGLYINRNQDGRNEILRAGQLCRPEDLTEAERTALKMVLSQKD